MGKTVGVLTSGGDAPGMNAAIRAVTRSALERGYEVYGIRNGFKGLVNGDFIKFERNSVSGILNRGGTFLGSARMPEFINEEMQNIAIAQMKNVNMDALVVIGGDGTYRGGYDLAKKGIKVIGIPATIDNDVVGTEYSIGFYTAWNTIVEAIDKLRDTSASHHRCSVVEVMGNKCGDLALYSGVCVGAEVIIVPEDEYKEEEVLAKMCYLDQVKKGRHAIVVATEKLVDVNELAQKISNVTTYSGRATILGHIQRGGSPVPNDRLLATLLGDKAVELLDSGISGHCVGIVDDEIISTDIIEAIDKGKEKKKDLYKLFNRLV
ncbi:MAG TPA: 6-phosphofructokinase [Erysipelotrichaceae bacterium]|jgi:6-phosphofructokinase 1|nr:6-phosphofructokinase [Erysipelotrichia bacterium]HPX32137.1 6-phosphofructokinase [Erysipelotrichaceae bacterium]HQA84530.1 6-phosphofructokinase [Erysipelotrichaceae bacterium]